MQNDPAMVQGSAEWLASRVGLVTASKVKDVMTKGGGATRRNYMMQLLCERLTGVPGGPDLSRNPAVQRGNEQEPFARMAYEIDKGVITEETGLVLHPGIEGFGASPDGLVGEHGLIEIKCPGTANHVAVIQSQRHDPQYEWQMLAQMACTGRDWVDFVSFDDRLPEPLQYVCCRFERDDTRIRAMENEIRAFLEELAELEQDMRERMNNLAA
jgi:putative phage-type endonuclease